MNDFDETQIKTGGSYEALLEKMLKEHGKNPGLNPYGAENAPTEQKKLVKKQPKRTIHDKETKKNNFWDGRSNRFFEKSPQQKHTKIQKTDKQKQTTKPKRSSSS